MRKKCKYVAHKHIHTSKATVHFSQNLQLNDIIECPACLECAAAVNETHHIVDAILSAIVVGFGCPNAHTSSCCICDCVSGNGGVVCMAGDTYRIRFTIRSDERTGCSIRLTLARSVSKVEPFG